MSLSLEPERRSRKPSLTPMIDVVFLLLVFFMLASRFGIDMQVPLQLAGQGGSAYSGPPRLVDIGPEALWINGVGIELEELAARLDGMTETPADTIILRARDEARLQRVIAVMEELGAAGFTTLVLVE